MNILAIDTSCDDTSVAISKKTTILSNVISSQDEIHSQWGGVVPSLAKRAHQERIDEVIQLCLKRAHMSFDDIDVFSVTYGPGLAVSLEVGVEKAKELSIKYNKPLVAVNHMVGHLCANYANQNIEKNVYPQLALLVSGGHTELVSVLQEGEYKILGQTLDDACGEAFDKVARLIGLGYPGGALLSKLAEDGDDTAYKFTTPLHTQKNMMFSFSGIKTAAFRLVQSLTDDGKKPLTKKQTQDIAASFQKVCIKHLVEKTEKAVELISPSSLLLGGGVSANLLLRKQLRTMLKKYNIPLVYPKVKKLCMDNAAMIAVAANMYIKRDEFVKSKEKLERNPIATIEEHPTWS